ncbi:MAG: DUF4476 domain-containing protein [Flavobacteriales bacterium]
MKATLLFLSVFSFSIFTFAGDCEKAMSKEDHTSIVTAIKAEPTYKVQKVRTLTIGKCLNGDQMLELLSLVTEKNDKLDMFNILAGKIINQEEYAKVKKTFLN